MSSGAESRKKTQKRILERNRNEKLVLLPFFFSIKTKPEKRHKQETTTRRQKKFSIAQNFSLARDVAAILMFYVLGFMLNALMSSLIDRNVFMLSLSHFFH